MANGKVKIDPDVEEVLRAAKIDGCHLKITRQLERKLYQRTNKVLAALGGKWNRGAQAHIFPRPVSEILEESLNAGIAIDKKKALCQFFTPPDIVQEMIWRSKIHKYPRLRILEPSAGDGRILEGLRPWIGAADIVAVEISLSLTNSLRERFREGIAFQCCDFLQQNGNLGKFDIILMNPPFDNGLDITHIEHAESMLAPGGRLVALCGNGPRQQKIFKHRTEYWEQLPQDSFKAEGTGINVAMLVLDALPAGEEKKQFADGLF